MSFSIR